MTATEGLVRQVVDDLRHITTHASDDQLLTVLLMQDTDLVEALHPILHDLADDVIQAVGPPRPGDLVRYQPPAFVRAESLWQARARETYLVTSTGTSSTEVELVTRTGGDRFTTSATTLTVVARAAWPKDPQ